MARSKSRSIVPNPPPASAEAEAPAASSPADRLLERRQRWHKVGARRIERVLASLRALRKCANRAGYEYTAAELGAMKVTVEAQVAATLGAFDDPVKKAELVPFSFAAVLEGVLRRPGGDDGR